MFWLYINGFRRIVVAGLPSIGREQAASVKQFAINNPESLMCGDEPLYSRFLICPIRLVS